VNMGCMGPAKYEERDKSSHIENMTDKEDCYVRFLSKHRPNVSRLSSITKLLACNAGSGLQVLLAEGVDIDLRTAVQRGPLRFLLEEPVGHDILFRSAN